MKVKKPIKELLKSLTNGISLVLGENLLGFYLTGSLTYDDFNPLRSDIDLLAVVRKPLNSKELVQIKKLHLKIENQFKKWAKRIECSYLPVELMKSILPPKKPRPYYGEGVLYPQAPYGNEWIINQYLLYYYSVALKGPEFSSLVDKPIDIKDVQDACRKDLVDEWQPKIQEPKYLNNSHYQSYVILNLCRILYTIKKDDVASKSVSSKWVINNFGDHWGDLIREADTWSYGKQMNRRGETIDFIKFVLEKVKNVK